MKAEMWQNPSKAPVGLLTIHAKALAQCRVNQLFLVKLNYTICTESTIILIWFQNTV